MVAEKITDILDEDLTVAEALALHKSLKHLRDTGTWESLPAPLYVRRVAKALGKLEGSASVLSLVMERCCDTLAKTVEEELSKQLDTE